jgi:3D (Asp-Asp-Asp) domain-containing protein
LIGRFICAFAVAICNVCPAIASSGAVTHVTWHRDGVLTWERVERHATKPQTIHQLTINLGPGRSKLIAPGSSGVVDVRVRYAQRDGGRVHQTVISKTVVRAAKPRIVADGIGATSLAFFEANGIARMAFMARSAMEMLATAYTADSAGGDGMTAIGRRAGHGIVAVDPHVIPLGTRLYIPGYGLAVAGDTGGDIVGHRIDLGFDSMRDAMLFGRRAVKVYRL